MVLDIVMVKFLFKFMVRVMEWLTMIPIIYTGASSTRVESWSGSRAM